MIIHQFVSHRIRRKAAPDPGVIADILNQVAAFTDTADLVTALYLMRGAHLNRGTAYVRGWMDPGHFRTGRGKWAITRGFPQPELLPQKFKLIRLRLDPQSPPFPRIERDTYGWEFTLNRFEDHLALLFAHELHHYRRYHLNLHPGEGEQGANKWALAHSTSLGFQVRGLKRKSGKRRKSAVGAYLRQNPHKDPYAIFRNLKQGDVVSIGKDPLNRYTGQDALILRPIRTNSKRMVIRTMDGKEWRWPLQWLSLND